MNKYLQCHYTFAHFEHEWYPLIKEPDANVMYISETPVLCPGLNTNQPGG
jgi:hypothetical protein